MDSLGKHPSGDRDGAVRRLICDHHRCGADAVHRAPKGRERLNELYWFCLEHIREYNRQWNYCAGLSEQQIEREIRNDTVWRRPTWPLGSREQACGFRQQTWFRDDLGVFGTDARREHDRNGPRPPAPVRSALRIMGFDAPVNLTGLKSRYKELVKRLHPDANGGDTVAEDKLKDVNQAYATLKAFVTA